MSAARVGRALAITGAAIGLAVYVSAGACGSPPSDEPPRPPEDPRIVSLVPAASGILVALGAEGFVVGRTSDDRTDGLADVPSVGRVLSPDVERVAALLPTHVVVWASGEHRALRGALPAGGSLVPLALERLADVGPAIHRLGALAARRRAAGLLARRIGGELERVADEVEGRPAVPTVWVVWADPPIVAGGATLPDDLLRASGGLNLFGDAPVPWPRPSLEALAALEPEAVVWPIGPGMPDPSRLPPRSPWRRWHRARFVTIDGDLVHEAGAHVARAAAVLAAGLRGHPDASFQLLGSDSPAATGGPRR